MTPKMQALLCAVLPQDLNVRDITEWSEVKATERRREGRLVGKLLLLGIIAGVVLGYVLGYGISIGMLVGAGAGLLLGWCIVGWQRHYAVA